MRYENNPAKGGIDADGLTLLERRRLLNTPVSSADPSYGSQRRKITLPAEITAWLNKEVPE